MPPGGDGFYYFSVFFLVASDGSMDKSSVRHRRINKLQQMMKDKQCVALPPMLLKVSTVWFSVEMR